MKKLFATFNRNTWNVYPNRIHSYQGISEIGSGESLPAAYLDYLRKSEKAQERKKADKAEEQRCIDAIKKIERKEKTDYTPEMDMLPEEFYGPSKCWWQFWK